MKTNRSHARVVSDSLKFQHSILPLAFFLPETSLGLGVTGITTFRRQNESETNRPSQFLYSAVYTFKNQLLLFLPYEIYTRDNHHRIKGELGYYRYFYNYFGIGTGSSMDDLEIYSVNFPRIDFAYAITLDKRWYYGAGFKFDYFDITTIEENGLLDTNQPIGYEGGTKANLLFTVTRENRNNIISATKGSYLELSFERSLSQFLSDFSYHKFKLDYRHYLTLNNNWVMALRALSTHASEETPFFDLEYISSPLRARGFSDRRFIAHNITTLQSEMRYPIYKRLSGVAFLSANHIYDDGIFAFHNNAIKVAYGSGLRFLLNKEEGTKIRLDIASGEGAFNLYITVNDAF